nr:RNA-directed DNA polymerase, eukaryota [Tanacetum cinerariifolium]
FGENNDNLDKEQSHNQPQNIEAASLDPFNIYPLLHKKHVETSNNGSENSIPFPPGFTPVDEYPKADDQVVKDKSPGSEGFCSRVMGECHQDTDQPLSVNHNSGFNGHDLKNGGSILEILDGMVKVGQDMGYDMGGYMKDMEKIIGLQGVRDTDFVSRERVVWVDIEGVPIHAWSRATFNKIGSKWGEVMEIEESIDDLFARKHICIKTKQEDNILKKFKNIVKGKTFVIRAKELFMWYPTFKVDNESKIYSDEESTKDTDEVNGGLGSKAKKDWTRELVVTRWQGDSLVLGDFNEVMSEAERRRSVFNIYGAADFNEFISNSGLIDIQLKGYSFTWSHLSVCKMSKLDRFLTTQGFFSAFPHCSAICLDRHLSDHRLILLREVLVDYGATPFRFYHSWLSISGFDLMVLQVWKSFSFGDSNDMIRFKKKLQVLKVSIREWIKTHKKNQMERRNDISLKLRSIDQQLDQGVLSDDLLLSRMNPMKQIHDFKMVDSYDALQKAKIKWAIEGDENSKFFHGLVNRNHANLAIKAASLEIPITTDEIRSAVWACGENKSPRPDGSKFEFFQRFWDVIGLDFCLAFKWFFDHNSFAKGCNSSFIALILKVRDPKIVSVLVNLISEVQSAFLPKRQILDGPFVINEVLSWCKLKKHQAILTSEKASVLVNGSPTSKFQFHCGLKQGDPLAPYLFILVMESLHLSFARVVEAGIFKGLNLSNSLTVSHLFYADDAINVHKSHLLGVGVSNAIIDAVATSLGCLIMKTPFNYLGVSVGGSMSTLKHGMILLGTSNLVSPSGRLKRYPLKVVSPS